jgi:hypothetical protein
MRRLVLAAGAAALLLGGACITPSIPIPPPEPQAMTFGVVPAEGLATFTYRPTQRFADAIVYVYNQDQGEGIITMARPDGGVGPTRAFPAVAGDRLIVTFEVDVETVSTCVRLREGTPTASDVCF